MTLFEKKVISGAAKLHAIGASEIEDLHRIAPKINVVLIPNGQALEEIQFALALAENLMNGQYLVSAGD